MLRRFLLFAVFSTSIVVAVVCGTGGVSSQTPTPGSLEEIAQETVARNETEVFIDADVIFESVGDLDTALNRYTLVEATPIASRSMALDPFTIGTWYKLKLNDLLKQNPLRQCSNCDVLPDPPADLAPGGDEIAILHPGGTTLVNGVSIFKGVPNFPDFNLNQKYLLFINYDPAKRVGVVTVGPPGAYLSDYAGNLMPVFTAEAASQNPIGQGLSAQYGYDLNRLRAALRPVPVDTSAYYKLVAQHSGKCLDVANASYANAASIIQFDCHEANNQKWRFEPLGNGYYRIISAHSGKCLDVTQGSVADGARVIQHDCHGGTNQQWIPNSDPDGRLTLRARHSGKVLDVEYASQNNGALTIQHTLHGGLNQKWALSLTAGPPPPPTCDPYQEQNCWNAGGSWDGASCYCYYPDPCYSTPWNCHYY